NNWHCRGDECVDRLLTYWHMKGLPTIQAPTVALGETLSRQRSFVGPRRLPPRTAHDTPWPLCGVLTVLQHLDAIHPHVLDARCVLVRPFECRMVGNALGIKNDDVGEVAGIELPAVLNPEGCRRK